MSYYYKRKPERMKDVISANVNMKKNKKKKFFENISNLGLTMMKLN